MSSYPRRPHDHLVEPVFAALRDASAEERRPRVRIRTVVAWLALAAALAALVWWMTSGS